MHFDATAFLNYFLPFAIAVENTRAFITEELSNKTSVEPTEESDELTEESNEVTDPSINEYRGCTICIWKICYHC